MKNKIFASILLLSALPMTAAADEIDFSYNLSDAAPRYFGYNKCDSYDVAVKLGPEMAGALVYGLRVPLPVDGTQADGMSVWASSELKLEKKQNIADIATTDATLAGGFLEATFQEPVTVPADGLFVGYSFKITSVESSAGTSPSKPVAYVEGNNPDGLYIHTARTMLKWKSIVSDWGVSPAVIRMSGDFRLDAAATEIPERTYMAVGKGASLAFSVTNHGLNKISSVDYEWSAGAHEGNGTYTLPQAVAGAFGATGSGEIELPSFDTPGSYSLSLTLTGVNGRPNTDEANSASGILTVTPFVPKNRPLVEEYTGLWCQYCPRGYVALEELNDKYGDDVILVSYHNDDEMEVTREADFPIAQFVDRINYPTAHINREDIQDPSDVDALVGNYASRISPASVDVTAKWTDDTRKKIKATADVSFIENFDSHDFRVAMILVADGLSNPTWYQMNAFSGESGDRYPGPYWDLFTQGKRRVTGLTFNFIHVASDPVGGISEALPSAIEMDRKYSCTREFDLTEIVNTKNNSFLNDGCTFRVIAVVIDGSGKNVVNSNRSGALTGYSNGGSGILSAGVEENVSEEYYDISGKRVSSDATGMLIRKTVKGDGSVRTEKTIHRR